MQTFTWRKLSIALLSAAALSGVTFAQRGGGPAGPQQATTPEPLKFRYMGPAAAGRIATVAGVPGDPSFEDGYRIACISDAALQSAEAGGWVEVQSERAAAAR